MQNLVLFFFPLKNVKTPYLYRESCPKAALGCAPLIPFFSLSSLACSSYLPRNSRHTSSISSEVGASSSSYRIIILFSFKVIGLPVQFFCSYVFCPIFFVRGFLLSKSCPSEICPTEQLVLRYRSSSFFRSHFCCPARSKTSVQNLGPKPSQKRKTCLYKMYKNLSAQLSLCPYPLCLSVLDLCVVHTTCGGKHRLGGTF